jgi:hypothetical protein
MRNVFLALTRFDDVLFDIKAILLQELQYLDILGCDEFETRVIT